MCNYIQRILFSHTIEVYSYRFIILASCRSSEIALNQVFISKLIKEGMGISTGGLGYFGLQYFHLKHFRLQNIGLTDHSSNGTFV